MRGSRALVLLVVAGAGPVHAEPDQAEEPLRRGVELRTQGRDAEALPLFREAFERSPSPVAAAQLGLCEQALGRWVDAEAHLGQALRAEGDPWIVEHRTALIEARDFVVQHLADLEVLGPAGATVKVNGQVAGTLPLSRPVRVVSGSLALAVSQAGHLSVTRTVTVEPGALARETVELAAQTPMELQSVAAAAPPRPRRRIWPWIVGGVVVAVGVSIAVAVPLSLPSSPSLRGGFGTIKEN